MTTVETILTEIAKLSPDEQEQLRQQLNESYARTD
jgi:hypothetical protein